ncbi:MAG: hypothetical protein IJ213_05970 [Bacteroidales bacterium]|nr:hypothetical protein [Bacteroidales bacterium]
MSNVFTILIVISVWGQTQVWVYFCKTAIYLPTVEYKTEDYNTRLGIFCKVGLQGEYKLTNYLSLLLSDGFLFGTLNEKDLPDASLNIYKAKRIQPIYSNYFSIGLKFSF